MPIYIVETKDGEVLVDAKTRSAAINHVIRNTVKARTVTPTEIVEKMQAGINVEKASAEAETEAAEAAQPETEGTE